MVKEMKPYHFIIPKGFSLYKNSSIIYQTHVSPSTVQKWISSGAALLDVPEIHEDVREIEFDEMWHFIGTKKTNAGSSKPFLVRVGELSPGLSAIVILKHSKDATRKSNI